MATTRRDVLNDEQNEALRAVLRDVLRTSSQTAVAEKLGVSQAVVSKFLSGRQGMSIPTAARLCSVAGRDSMEVIGDVGLPFRPGDDTDPDFAAAAAYFARTVKDPVLASQVVAEVRANPQWRSRIDGAEGWLDVLKGEYHRAKMGNVGDVSARDDGGGPRKVR